MVDQPPPTLRLSLDKQALAHNWRALDRMSGDAQTGAAVKADCYGLGVDACVPTLRDAGVGRFYVAHWSEVAGVAEHVPADQISVLHGPMNVADVAYARATGAIPVINSLAQAKIWIEAGGGPCDLMIDTGISRLGLEPENASDPLIDELEVETLMSHLACADEDSSMNEAQLARFREVLPGITHQRASLANSAGIALGRNYAFDLTRPGLSLYGGVPRTELSGEISQVARPEAAIIQCRQLGPGDTVGYNAQFTASAEMKLGIVSIGYADGLLRRCGDGGYLQHGEKKLPIVGKISMDMIGVDLTNAPDLKEGDWLELPYFLPDAAQQTSLSQYELLTVLGTRLKQS